MTGTLICVEIIDENNQTIEKNIYSFQLTKEQIFFYVIDFYLHFDNHNFIDHAYNYLNGYILDDFFLNPYILHFKVFWSGRTLKLNDEYLIINNNLYNYNNNNLSSKKYLKYKMNQL